MKEPAQGRTASVDIVSAIRRNFWKRGYRDAGVGGGWLNREKLADMTTPDDRALDEHRAELIRQTAELKDVAGRAGLDVAFIERPEDLEDATATTMFVVWRRGEPMPTGNDQSFLTFDQARDFIARYTDVPTPRDGRA